MYAIFFIFVSGILPMVFAGGRFDHTTLFYLFLIIGVNLVLSLVNFSFIMAFSLMIVHHIVALLGSISFGNNPHKEFLNLIVKVVVDSTYIGASGIILGLI
jgi:hypothetical protein